MIVEFIDAHKEEFGVEPNCEVLQVAPSTYYAHRSRPPSARSVRDAQTSTRIATVHQDNYGVYGARKVHAAIAAQLAGLPEQLRRSLTWDQGAELAQHAQLEIDTGIAVHFCDPHSPWQRPSNENTNGLLRQYFPKGTDLSRWDVDDLQAIAVTLNARPRKTLGWRTPAEVFSDQLASAQQAGVASNP